MTTIGDYQIELLSEGLFEAFQDGSFEKLDEYELGNRKRERGQGRRTDPLFGAEEDADFDAEDENPENPLEAFIGALQAGQGGRKRVGIDPVLIRDGKNTILLDTGMGLGLDADSKFTDISNIKANLEIFGIDTRDVTHVILSHLHVDHASGASFSNDQLQTEATFPNAKYLVHKDEWNYAIRQETETPVNTSGPGYDMDNWYRLYADGQLVLLNHEIEKIMPGMFTIRTGGHTPGHQIVRLQQGKEIAYFLGDLIPNDMHLNRYEMEQSDYDPYQAQEMKRKVLDEAWREKAMMLFYHARYAKYGRLTRDRHRKFIVQE